jgi:hypothetical protein
VRLLNVFREVLPFEVPQPVKSGSAGKQYAYTCRIERDPEAPRITLEMLESYLQGLRERMRQKYGEEAASLFYLGRRTIEGRRYVYLGRKKKRVEGLNVGDGIPIYFDLESGEVYVPAYYMRRKPKLTKFLLMRVLGALKQTRRVFLGRVVEEEVDADEK